MFQYWLKHIGSFRVKWSSCAEEAAVRPADDPPTGPKIKTKLYSAPYLVEDNLRTRSMLSFSGPLHFHRKSLNNALFLKWPLD